MTTCSLRGSYVLGKHYLLWRRKRWGFTETVFIVQQNKGVKVKVKVKVKQSIYGTGESLRVPRGWCSHIWWLPVHEGSKVVSPTHRPPLPLTGYSCYYFCQSLSRHQGHSAAGRIMSMKIPSKSIGNLTRALQACRSVSQTTAPPSATKKHGVKSKKNLVFGSQNRRSGQQSIELALLQGAEF